MGKLSASECFKARSDPAGCDHLLGDGDGLFLRIRANGTRTSIVEYLFEGKRRRSMIGFLDKQGAASESISSWLHHGRLSLAQASAIAGEWKADRRAGRDPIAAWEAHLTARHAVEEAQRQAIATLQALLLQALHKRTGKEPDISSGAASTTPSPGCSSAACWRT